MPTMIPGSVSAALKRFFLGKPMINAQLRDQRLSKKVALGVLSPDAISSSAYGPEQILVGLLPVVGIAAFTLVLPITGLILLILVLVTASYRQVVMVYTKAGGSYVVARDNFGPRVAQVAAAALLIDYVVTVAVQTAAGTVAVVSAVPALGPYSLEITVGVVILICYANLRGLREAGRSFAVPTYLFAVLVGGMIVVGLIKAVTVGLPVTDPTHLHGALPLGHLGGLEVGVLILAIARSFANGGSSLTGVEAISNTVSVFREPRGVNARRVLLAMSCILGFLIAGIAVLAYLTHATPYEAGYPSVLSQEARAVFGSGVFGTVMFVLIQAASALILYTGANTSFNGFPFLASFVAEDRFLPRQLTKRGQRLVYSNGIIVLTVLAVVLLIVSGGTVTSLVPFYAIGVFTGFAMAGFGMSQHYRRVREGRWRLKLTINLSAAILSTLVVLIFAVAKFTEGAWLIVIVFPLLVMILIRLNREYRAEAAVLEEVTTASLDAPDTGQHQVLVLVSTLDLAAVEALRYGGSLHADRLQAVHFVIDTQAAERLRTRWERFGITVPLRFIDVPDRQLPRAAYKLVTRLTTETDKGDVHVTVLLPRRSYAPILGRLLHDRTADRIARVVSRVPQAAATIVPYDVQQHIRAAMPHLPEERPTQFMERMLNKVTADPVRGAMPESSSASVSAGTTTSTGRESAITVEGTVSELTIIDQNNREEGMCLTGTIDTDSGPVTVAFRAAHNDLEPGQTVRLTGTPRRIPDAPVKLVDPDYVVLVDNDAQDETQD
ncbi:APC family permease [Humibacter antri]